MNNWLLFDVPSLAHRTFHSSPDQSIETVESMLMFGLLRDIRVVQQRFSGCPSAFCFDSKYSKRKEVYSNYKKRKPQTDEETASRNELQQQIKRLRQEVLPEIGYENIFIQKGVESDDLIAALAQNLPKGHSATIVSSDKDMHQCLSNRVDCYDPRKKAVYRLKDFKRDWGIEPSQWAAAKALAGDVSDNIKGIQGIGLVYACRYLAGKLKEGSQAFAKIEAGAKSVAPNIELMKLPYPGTKVFELIEDRVTERQWVKAAKRLGMPSLVE